MSGTAPAACLSIRMAETTTAHPEARFDRSADDLIVIMQAEFRHLRELMDARIAAVDARFDAQYREVAGLRESVNKRFGMLMWILGIGFSGGIALLLLMLRALILG